MAWIIERTAGPRIEYLGPLGWYANNMPAVRIANRNVVSLVVAVLWGLGHNVRPLRAKDGK